jgi:hypothetical protein
MQRHAVYPQAGLENLHVLLGPRIGARIERSFSPQTRHKPKKADAENGGFLQVTADHPDVAKTAPKGRFISVQYL